MAFSYNHLSEKTFVVVEIKARDEIHHHKRLSGS